MGSTSRAQQASMRRCPGAAGAQYSMYPVPRRAAQLVGEGENTSKTSCRVAPAGAAHTAGCGVCAAHLFSMLRARVRELSPSPIGADAK